MFIRIDWGFSFYFMGRKTQGFDSPSSQSVLQQSKVCKKEKKERKREREKRRRMRNTTHTQTHVKRRRESIIIIMPNLSAQML
jgi:hypothetical protein